jgi:hypothetical protein
MSTGIARLRIGRFAIYRPGLLYMMPPSVKMVVSVSAPGKWSEKLTILVYVVADDLSWAALRRA